MDGARRGIGRFSLDARIFVDGGWTINGLG